ncbi:MAG: ribonuclease HII, partial [Pseudomonadota bacterium]|nr:ribonuclease HII [Pseudomonadota bacterium]
MIKELQIKSGEIRAASTLEAGTDEVGRGPLAGDVVAAAVILHPDRRVIG